MHPFVPPPEPEVEGPQPQPQFQQPEEADVFSLIADVAKKDPNLALVAFRIELEKRLAALAAQYGISDSGRGAGFLLRELRTRHAIPLSVASGLSELIALGNQAAHGASVSPDAAEWVLEVGPTVLGILDEAIQKQSSGE